MTDNDTEETPSAGLNTEVNNTEEQEIESNNVENNTRSTLSNTLACWKIGCTILNIQENIVIFESLKVRN